MNPSGGKHIVYIATGSNIGDGLANCRDGIAALGRRESVEVGQCSHFYRSAPVGYADQPWFINAVFRIRTDMSPLLLLKTLKAVESDAGRDLSGIRFGPRVLDFDIIFFNDEIIDTKDLIVPHPRMHQREFVLRPMCDLSPGFIHPVLKKSIREILEASVSPEHPCVRIPNTQSMVISCV
jgi:2-amino-4-hydroxy-6-hydroxymethyldihydropteridine diphosphokinase